MGTNRGSQAVRRIGVFGSGHHLVDDIVKALPVPQAKADVVALGRDAALFERFIDQGRRSGL